MDYRYKNFLDLFKTQLKEIFYPIKRYFEQNGKDSKFDYLIIPENCVLLNNTKQKLIVTNINKLFYFAIKPEDIKPKKIHVNDTEIKEFWTCGKEFTQYYLEKYINKRICIKSEESFKSIDYEDDEDLNHESYYLYPSKEFNFEQSINSFINLDFDNPPEELYFLIKKGNYSSEYKLQEIEFEKEKSKTFFHNAKIGISLGVLDSARFCYIQKMRVFYFNCEYIFKNDCSKRKKYFLYFLSFLFHKSEAEDANNFLTNVYYNFKKYNENFISLFKVIVKNFPDDEGILIIFDDVHSKEHYDFITNLKDEVNLGLKQNISIRIFIQLNEDTLNILKKIIEKDEFHLVKTIGNCEKNKLSNDLNIFIGLLEYNQDYLIKYKKIIEIKLNDLFARYSINKYILLIKLYYYLYIDDISKETLKDIILLDEIKEFIDYLYINISKKMIKFDFRNKIIEYYFNNYYIHYSSIFFFEESKNLLNKLLETEIGINFEKHVIYSIIIGNMEKTYRRIKVNRIYCFENFPKFEFDNRILFEQIISNAPLYDFAVLFRNNKGEVVLKVYQVFINKRREEFEKLEKNKIFYDLSYFIEKINRALNIKIQGFTFGIITSYKSFNKKNENNFKLISDFCNNNNYELILFDIDENKFYLQYNNEKNNLKKINSFEEIDSDYIMPLKIFKSNIKIFKKFYIENINPSIYLQIIKNVFSSFTNKNIKMKLVGKFHCDISAFEQHDKIVYYYRNNNSEDARIYYNKYQLNKNINNNIENMSEKDKKEILVFLIENSNCLKEKYFHKCEKVDFMINEKDIESDIKYLFSEEKEDILYLLEKEEKEKFKTKIKKEEAEKSKSKIIKKNTENDDKTSSQNQSEKIEFLKDINEHNFLRITYKKHINFDSIMYQPYIINKITFEQLLNGNIEIYNKLIDEIKNKENINDDDTINKNKFLGKKRESEN